MAVEAYSWGGLISGASGVMGWLIRALWLLLLPCALANLAYWTRPELAFWTARSGDADQPKTPTTRDFTPSPQNVQTGSLRGASCSRG